MKLKGFLFILLLNVSTCLLGQSNAVRHDTLYHKIEGDTIYLDYKVDTMAHFLGGDNGMLEHIQRYLRYPSDAREKEISGRSWASFVIEKDGSITDLLIVKGLFPSCDKEVLDVLRVSSGKWVPAYKYGIPVRSQYILPLNFSIK
jgi:hypothetical protein